MEHYTVEDFKKCEILRDRGYKIKSYPFKYKIFLYGCFGVTIPSVSIIPKLIAYKEDIEEITQEFAEKHLMPYVFDRFVAKGE